MAARRLLAVLIMLLVISSIAAALAPTRQPTESSTTTTTTTTADPNAREGKLIERRIAIPASGEAKQEPKRNTIRALVGDQLALEVTAEATTDIEIAGLGLYETAAPGSPARFDLLVRDVGHYPIRIADGEQIGKIVVADPA